MTAGDVRARRLAENEALFRAVNESIGAIAVGHRTDEHVYEFLCECSKPECFGRIELTVPEYERVRRKAEHFALVAGHEDLTVERVVERHGRYVIVEKFGEGAEVARELDPRGG